MKNSIIGKKLWLIPLILFSVILVSAFISYLFIGNLLFQSLKYFFDNTLYGIMVGCVFWAGNATIGYLTANKLNWRKNVIRSNIIALLSFIIFGIIASMAVPYIHGKYFIPYHIDDLQRYVVLNSFINLSVDVVILSIYYTLHLVRNWKKTIENEEELKRENLTAKYEALKNQVNPHFLFNSLNTLTGIVEQDSDKAVDYIKHLSNIYRYVLEQRDKELVSVEEELKFVDDYIFLAKLRHGDGLRYNISVTSRHKMIVPLGLQILIENCIKHNVIEDEFPLKIEIYEVEKYIVVKNNLQKKKTIAKQEKIGLDNLTNRYTFVSDLPVLINESEESFEVKIPIVENSL